MKRIDLMVDMVPPVAVTAVNILAQKSTTTVMGQSLQQVLNYGMTVGGYLAYYMGWGGAKYSEFLKNIGIASAPGSLVALYNKISPPVAGALPASIQGRRVSHPVTRVSRYPGPASESPFQGVRLV